MKTLEPTQVKVGQRIRVTHHAKTGGPLVDGCMVYEGAVTAVGNPRGAVDEGGLAVRLDPPYYDPNTLSDDGWLPIHAALAWPWVERVTVELLPYRSGAIVRGTGTLEGMNTDFFPDGRMAVLGSWMRFDGHWQLISPGEHHGLWMADPDLDSGQCHLQIDAVLYAPRYDEGDPASPDSEGSAS